ncbi:hypothetical protein [Limnoglobus roseus]|uniref:Uncharacterized protein n=1 Tax=Limnoglobus roseus TaxID=2598579 RepID=A0A5C1AQ23_9BACT|nr:hypothetical protein [Limnoglobus roseus]QEL19862.1 hypothetical protein PX52LOC_06943 [Limnoglobus roseus]
MGHVHVNLGILALTCGILSAKWSMELGMNQFRQLLWGVAGVLLGPLALLILYVRHLGARQANGVHGAQWISGRAATTAVVS